MIAPRERRRRYTNAHLGQARDARRGRQSSRRTTRFGALLIGVTSYQPITDCYWYDHYYWAGNSWRYWYGNNICTKLATGFAGVDMTAFEDPSRYYGGW